MLSEAAVSCIQKFLCTSMMVESFRIVLRTQKPQISAGSISGFNGRLHPRPYLLYLVLRRNEVSIAYIVGIAR